MEFITTAAAAEILGVSTRRVQALIAAGRLKAHRPGREYLLNRDDVEAYQALPEGWQPGVARGPRKTISKIPKKKGK